MTSHERCENFELSPARSLPLLMIMSSNASADSSHSSVIRKPAPSARYVSAVIDNYFN